MTASKPRPAPAPGETRAYPVLPLRDIVVFPHMIVPLFVGREKSIKALEEVMRSDTFILLATQKNASDDDPATGAIFQIGTLASVLQLLKLPDGTVKVLVEGAERAKILEYNERPDYYEANAVVLADETGDKVEAEALARSVVTEFEGYVKLNKKVSPEVIGVVQQIEDYGKLGDTVASHLAVKIPDKQGVLETTKVAERLEKVLALMESEISVLQVEKRIRTRVKRQMEKTQREYYLNEQMKAIQKELGDEEGRDELTELEEKIKKTKLSKEAREKAMHELKKLKQMSPMSAEATVVRNYLDWLLSIPWNKKSKVKKDLPQAQQILDHDHYGLEKVKERIVEYLAVQSRANKLTGPILCLVGPPGVGKTSLGKSIAKATGPRVRARVARRRARRGRDPRPPAHLYRLDARQDHPVDAQGEDLEPAVPARRGRQDGRRFPRRSVLGAARGARSGAEQHVQRPLSRGRLRSLQRDVHHHGEHAQHPAAPDGPHGDHPHRRLHREREGGDRAQAPDPERDHQARARHEGMVDRRRRAQAADPPLHAGSRRAQSRARAVHAVAQGGQGADAQQEGQGGEGHRGEPVRLSRRAEVPLRRDRGEGPDRAWSPGLAWTDVGGELLTIEGAMMPGKGRMTVTGNLRDVMKESISAAASYVRSRAVAFGIEPPQFDKRDIHVHVPEGATPKDGPSAGVAMVTAIVSVMTGIPVRRDVAMTGEITLRGRVLPIGGLKEKLLAAHRGGIKTVLIPEENAKDLVEISDQIKGGLDIIPVSRMDEVLAKALVRKPEPIEWDEATAKPVDVPAVEDDSPTVIAH